MKARTLLVPFVTCLLLTHASGPAAAQPPNSDQHIDRTAEQLTVVIEKYDLAREQLKNTQAKATQVAQQLAPLRAQVAALSNEVGQVASALYRGSSLNTVTILTHSTSVEEFTDNLALIQHLARTSHQRIAELNKAKKGLEEQKRTLDAILAEQTRTEREIAGRKANIERELVLLTTAHWGDPRSSRNHRRDSYVPPYKTGKSGSAIQFAYRQIGRPYIFGAEGPRGYDCSGLTLAAWRTAGVELPHSAALQRQVTQRVSEADLRPGDLVFYYDDLHHVGIYVGAGRIIHAPQPGQNVTMAPLHEMPVNSYGRPRIG